ncbi:phosphate/phosphite/phosphonate ABC transporter substrate-binding protein [Boseongicola aestuarii]|uniref:ABC transporter, phosphonate, periplasmic substrate-binding protein n=1 Tax=Boseongicola aestuarii TaxID=1470561 RepID=A0A238IXZ2_9RHOB|nr:PhnD/SsuA/transferrin family substrate-binding protein [Boseongicola aestuarii]SMX22620.1 ABC transporter, phosphonate, periplasmic substrate-binding protein [Boseongicola aestuarii]
MISALPMYWFAETKAAHVAFWSLTRDHLRAHGVKAPKSLNETKSPHQVWSAPDLVLSHICNLPYRAEFKNTLTRIGACDYGLEGCGPGQYRALFIVRTDHPAQTPEELAGATMALNSDDSHSGWGAAANWALARSIRFKPTCWTGSHQHSLGAVIAGDAAFCTIDAQTFEILKRIDPKTRLVRVLGATEPSPGMTFVTARGNDPAPFDAAIKAAIVGLDDRHRTVFGLKNIIALPNEAYEIPLPPDPRSWQT